MAKIKVTSLNIDARAVTWLTDATSRQNDNLIFYDEGFKYGDDELTRLAFNAGHIVQVIPSFGKLKEIHWVSGTIA
jgi:hypothetical protein